jgi:transcriptional regulator with XRE-family HTH domain
LIGKILKELRIQNNLNQSELGNIIGISRSIIGHYENEQNSPPIDVLEKLADYFNVSTDYLLGRTEIKNIEDMIIEHKKEYSVSEKDIEYIKELYNKIKDL